MINIINNIINKDLKGHIFFFVTGTSGLGETSGLIETSGLTETSVLLESSGTIDSGNELSATSGTNKLSVTFGIFEFFLESESS